MRKRLTAVAMCAALTALSASPALAGEVTGSGKKENQNQGRSWCSFSGLNDDPTASTVPPIGDERARREGRSRSARRTGWACRTRTLRIRGPSATRTGPRCPRSQTALTETVRPPAPASTPGPAPSNGP